MPFKFNPLTGSIDSVNSRSEDATFGGEINAKKLTLTDDTSAGPIFMLKTDDAGPWGFIIKNDTYSENEEIGFKAFQANNGDFHIEHRGDASYNNFYFKQYNGTTPRTALGIDTNGNATFAGHINIAEQKQLDFANGDFYFKNSGIDNYIVSSVGDLQIHMGLSQLAIKCTQDEGCDLYYDASDHADPKLSTTANGAKVQNTTGAAQLNIEGGSGSTATIQMSADAKEDNADTWRLQAEDGSNFTIGSYSTGTWVPAVSIAGSSNATFAGWVYGDRFINSTTSEDPWLKGVNASGTETSYIKKDGTAYFAGDVKMAATKGIQFSNYGAEESPDVAATDVTGNTLDDYEEGTWIPGFAYGFSAAEITDGTNGAIAKGWYTKIGDLVTAQFYMRLGTSGTSTTNGSQIKINGFPFSSSGTSYSNGGGATTYVDFASTIGDVSEAVSVYGPDPGTAVAQLYRGSQIYYASNDAVQTGKYIIGMVTYKV